MSVTNIKQQIVELHEHEKKHQAESVVVLTYATHKQGYFDVLVESCERYGYELRVLGMGDKWLGYGQKLAAFLAALRTMPAEQLVLCVDAFDVFLCGPASEVPHILRNVGSPAMLVGASRAMGNFKAIHRRMYGDDGDGNTADARCAGSPYSVLCAGTYLCRAAACVELLSAIGPIDSREDDQSLLNKVRRRFGADAIALDCTFQAFATLLPASVGGKLRKDDGVTVVWHTQHKQPSQPSQAHTTAAQKKDTQQQALMRRVHCAVTDTLPILVHGAGDTDLRPLVQQMGFASRWIPTPRSYVDSKVRYHMLQFAKAYQCEALAMLGLLCIAIAFALFGVAVARERKYYVASVAQTRPLPVFIEDGKQQASLNNIDERRQHRQFADASQVE